MTEQQGEYGFEKLLETLREASFPEAEITRITQAYVFARNAHEGQKRRSGEPYIIHPVAVAQILAGMGMDGDSICAALLHDVVEDTPVTDQQVRASFGDSVAQLVDGVTKIGQIPFSPDQQEEQQNENIRKMFLAMARDIRVIIIKLADRVHNMRTLSFMPEEKRRFKAKETLEIYAPIAHRLGIRAFKEELEDLAIRYLDPVAYEEISKTLESQVESIAMILSPSPIQPIIFPRPSISTLSNPSFSISARIHSTTSFSSQLSLGWEIIARRNAIISSL